MDEANEEERFITGESTVADQFGVHARPSTLIVMTASKYPGRVYMRCLYNPECSYDPKEKYDCKSIMGMMNMGAAMGSRLKVHVEILNAENPKEAEKRRSEAETMCKSLV